MGVEYKDYYKVLGISRSASKDEVSRSFKKLARKYHPDFNPGNKEAELKFKEISEAYEVLKDDEKRRLYDQLGSNWQQGQQFRDFQGQQGFGNFSGSGFNSSGFSDFFESVFGAGAAQGGFQGNFGGHGFSGGRATRSRNGADIESGLSLTLEEAYKGGKKSVTIQEPGAAPKLLEVNIPVGVKEGGRIRLAGQGRPGVAGGKAGDLILRLHILEHPQFELENSNIVFELALAPWEAVLGLKSRVPTLDGEVELNIPAGVSSGTKLRLRGRGLGKDGDQFIRLSIKVPKEISEEEKKLWEELAAISSFNPR